MLLDRITLRNLLSFKDASLNLAPLNILIGETTSGKSNLIEAIGLLQGATVGLQKGDPEGRRRTFPDVAGRWQACRGGHDSLPL
jgi:DNA repair ATPase RecN